MQDPLLDQTTSSTVRIGMIDSGIDYNHEKLKVKSRPMLGIDLTNQARPPYDYTNSIQNELRMGKHFTHGTAVADIASRNLDALIIPVRIENQSRLAAEAVEYLAGKNVRIINISQGGYRQEEWEPLQLAIRNHPEILFIVAAGNESQNIDELPSYPSSLTEPNLIVVTSVNKQGDISQFSNFGSQHVHFAALGENVSAAHAGGGQWTVNGSSFAAPVVANLAASILQKNPHITTEELLQGLVHLANPSPALDGKVRYGVLGQ